jgi:hypothetical protein
MSNQEEKITGSQKPENDSLQSNAEDTVHSATTEGKIADPKHNTGNERMSVDEEGAEVGPDDEV